MARLCEPTDCSGFGLGSRKRIDCGSQGPSGHAGESGPWTGEGENKRQQIYDQ